MDVADSPLDGYRPSLRTARFAEEVAHGRDVTARFADNPYTLLGVLCAPFSVAAAPAAMVRFDHDCQTLTLGAPTMTIKTSIVTIAVLAFVIIVGAGLLFLIAWY